MTRLPATILSLLLLWAPWAGGCAPRPAPPPEPVDHAFTSLALLPVQFVTSQPDSFCHADIGDDLRRTLQRTLRHRGYDAFLVPDGQPQTFRLDPPPPAVGQPTDLLALAPAGSDTALGLWVEDYLATTLCEAHEPKQLDMTVVAVLYALPDGRELGRWRARDSDMGLGSSRETVWRVTTNLADKLLGAIP